MHALRFQETAKGRISKDFQYLLGELFTELYQDLSKEDLDFPSEDMLDMLHLYERAERQAVAHILKNYAEEIRELWCEYSLGSLMKSSLYLNCSTTGHGDLMLCKTPQVTS